MHATVFCFISHFRQDELQNCKRKGGTGFIVTSKGNVHLHCRWVTSIRSKQHSQVLEDTAILSSKNHLHLLPIIITDKATLSIYDAVVKQVNGSHRGR